MKYTAHLWVKLRVPDLVALTAKGVIIKNMRVNQLVDIQREDWWQIQIDWGLGIRGTQTEFGSCRLNQNQQKEVEGYARDIAEKSSLFVNPNKHSYRLRITDSGYPSGDWVVRIKFPINNQQSAIPNQQSIYVGVWHYDDSYSDIIKRTLRERLLYKKVEGVKKGVLWTLKIKAKDRKEAKNVAEEITLCKDRKKGLLSNPHVNYYRVF